MPRVLVLYWQPKGGAERLSVSRHLHVLDGRARVLYHNALDPVPAWIAWTRPDLCVLHTTFLCTRWFEDFESYRRRFAWVSRLSCPKVALPQDEYDHAEILDEWLLELGVSSVHSCFGPEQRQPLYPRLEQSGARFVETLTGFIDAAAAGALAPRLVPHSQRPRDIVYRARKLPYWFGSHGQLKHRIGEAVEERASELGLRTDISTRDEDTIYDGWLDFLMSGRAVIGCESGSSVLDARGEIQRRIRQMLEEQPDLTFAEVDARMPRGWDSYAFFAISPRHLEAVITKTAQVLVEGNYSGVLEPERHYIPLRSDLADLDEALDRLRDVAAVEEMAERAYRDVYLSGRSNLAVLADALTEEMPAARRRAVSVPFALARPVSLPVRSPVQGKPVRQLIPHVFTVAEALVRQPEARRLCLAAARGRLSLSLRDALKEVALLRVLARLRAYASSGGSAWSVNVESTDGRLVIRTQPGSLNGGDVALDRPFDSVAWNNSAAGQTAPVFPRHPEWGVISLGPNGRYEFSALAELARTDAADARALLERALQV